MSILCLVCSAATIASSWSIVIVTSFHALPLWPQLVQLEVGQLMELVSGHAHRHLGPVLLGLVQDLARALARFGEPFLVHS
jgi:hypothetical protein